MSKNITVWILRFEGWILQSSNQKSANHTAMRLVKRIMIQEEEQE